jgi:hypothetical protein
MAPDTKIWQGLITERSVGSKEKEWKQPIQAYPPQLTFR